MARRLLDGLQAPRGSCAAVAATRDALVAHGVVSASRVIVVPYGVHPTCRPRPDARGRREAARLLGPVDREALEILHVGSTIPRKRIDVLLDVFAAVRRRALRGAAPCAWAGRCTGAQQRQAAAWAWPTPS